MCMLFVMQSFIEDSRCFDVQMRVFYVHKFEFEFEFYIQIIHKFEFEVHNTLYVCIGN